MLDFSSIHLTIHDEAYVLSSEVPLTTLSSAVVGGGFQSSDAIINCHVPLDYDCSDPVNDVWQFAAKLELKDRFVGMMTGVPIRGTRIVNLHHEELSVSSIVTAGIGNVVTSGVSQPVPFKPGTINAVILIDARLVPSAMVNAIITATEAKASLLTDWGIKSPSGNFATGTSTDAIVIACTGRGEPLPYAGPGTNVGYLIGRSMRECLSKALEPCSPFYREQTQSV